MQVYINSDSSQVSHNLKFSTNPLPSKCKTKCIAFMHKPRALPSLKLCGNSLPWVNSGKHLGNTIENKVNGMQLDIKQKRAQYITKNNELIQEFSFSHPDAVMRVNQIYNTHFTGSPLWDLFSTEAVKLENTWNKSVRLMMDVPISTHRNLIEPISRYPHLRKVLIKRFLKFLDQIRRSSKMVPKLLLTVIQNNVRSTTGSNLRNILLQTAKTSIDKIVVNDANSIEYHKLAETDLWKVLLIRELTDVKFDEARIENLTIEDVETTLDFLCTS